MLGRDVVDELLYEHGLAHARAAEQAGLAALGVRFEQVDDLDARFQDIGDGTLLREAGRVAVYAHALGVFGKRCAAVYGFAEDVEHSAQRDYAHGHLYAAARRRHFGAARESVRFREHYAAHDVSAHVRSDFHVSDCSVRIHGKSFLYFRQRAVELYVHDRPGYAYYPSFHASVSLVFLAFCALAPAAISVISCVIAAWRTRL